MITLFRKIRQKLIDSGSVTKYLIYAIGDVLLVVLGILLALQVNNWNERRTADQKVYLLLSNLAEGIGQDIDQKRLSSYHIAIRCL